MEKKEIVLSKRTVGYSSRIHPMEKSGMLAKLDYQYYRDKSCRISGYIVDSRTCVRRNQKLYVTKVAQTPDEIPEAERLVLEKLAEVYTKMTSPSGKEEI